jgi:hypothetical protein
MISNQRLVMFWLPCIKPAKGGLKIGSKVRRSIRACSLARPVPVVAVLVAVLVALLQLMMRKDRSTAPVSSRALHPVHAGT